jgi:hypothetical protein
MVQERRYLSFQIVHPTYFYKGGIIMKKKWVAIIGSGVLFAGLVISGTSFSDADDSQVRGGTIRLENQVEADFPALAKLTSTQAVQKALVAVQGQILKTELENENGFLVYEVEVVTADKTIMEVKVDAGSGKVLVVDRDNAHEQEHGKNRDPEEEDYEKDDRDRED